MGKLKIQFALALFLSAMITVNAKAQEEKDSSENKDEPKTLVQIRSAMMKEQSEMLKGYRSAKQGSPEQKQALNRYYGVADKYAGQIIELAKADPTDRGGSRMLTQLVQMTRNAKVRNQAMNTMLEIAKKDPAGDSSFQMLMTLVTGPAPLIPPMIKTEAQSLLVANFGNSEKMGDFAMSMARAPANKENVKLLRDLIKDSKFDTVKGPATYALGKMLVGSKTTKDEGMMLIKSIPVKFKDVKVNGGRRSLAKMVEGEIFELERLQTGMQVPNIEAEDVDGVKFNLTDYKGKVVVIDFWGDW